MLRWQECTVMFFPFSLHYGMIHYGMVRNVMVVKLLVVLILSCLGSIDYWMSKLQMIIIELRVCVVENDSSITSITKLITSIIMPLHHNCVCTLTKQLSAGTHCEYVTYGRSSHLHCLFCAFLSINEPLNGKPACDPPTHAIT